jgi:predicted RNA binding protein YcfA (HicA-like mRNA interferase family)
MFARLPGTRAKEVIHALRRAGFVAEPQKATSHLILRHPLTKRTTSVPIHSQELPRWLLKKIIKDAGLTEDEFRALL